MGQENLPNGEDLTSELQEIEYNVNNDLNNNNMINYQFFQQNNNSIDQIVEENQNENNI